MLSSGFSSVTVVPALDEPVGLAFTKTGSQLFVWERPGRVLTVENGQKQLLLDISPEVGAWRDFGLLGFALHPQFETNGYFYLLYTVNRHHLLHYGTPSYDPKGSEPFNATISRLTRYTATRTAGGYRVDPASRKVLLGATKETGIPSLYMSHGPGSLVFGADGTLLVSAGDGASFDVVDGGSANGTYYAQALADGIIPPEQNVGAFRAQQLESYNGKILRLDPETGAGVASNPFYQAAAPNSVQSKVWALGLRNPFRMSLKPGSGSATDPGVLYLGDVGYDTWEEVDIAVRPGMNFGWPLFEGLTPHTGYWAKKTFNPYVPTGSANCSQPYFYFQDLIQQETPTGTALFSDPCAPNQALPLTVHSFVHSRPVIDWHHQATGPSRTGIFAGATASEVNLGAPGSPVAGPQFGGSAAVGGVFFTDPSFPPEYQNTFAIGDYSRGWIRSLRVDGSDKPVAVRNLIDQGTIVVGMATHPTEGGLYYVNFFPSEIKKVVYNAPVSTAPVAVATADKLYGPGPLAVQFTGSQSHDQQGQPLTYQWEFGDGTTSTDANPAHVFPAGSPTNYSVKLTVQNTARTGQATLVISANNTPPQVTITSPAEGTKYSLTGPTTYNLRAAVTDQEHSSSQLLYRWRTILHHNDHQHPEPAILTPEAATTISPLGCGSETYYYRITLTVTDPLGLATTKEVRLEPNCPLADQPPVANAGGAMSLTLPANSVILHGSGSDPDGSISAYAWMQVSGPAAGMSGVATPDLTATDLVAGSYTFRLTVRDNAGATASADATVTVNPASVITSATPDLLLNQASCYPNPFSDEFTVQVRDRSPGKLPVRLYDAVGREVLSLEDLPLGRPVRLGRNLSAGAYTLTVGSKRFILLKAN